MFTYIYILCPGWWTWWLQCLCGWGWMADRMLILNPLVPVPKIDNFSCVDYALKFWFKIFLSIDKVKYLHGRLWSNIRYYFACWLSTRAQIWIFQKLTRLSNLDKRTTFNEGNDFYVPLNSNHPCKQNVSCSSSHSTFIKMTNKVNIANKSWLTTQPLTSLN